MASKMLNKVKGIVASIVLCTAFVLPSSASANQITLTFVDHGFTLTGQFARFSGDSYIVLTEFGEVQVPLAMVKCSGLRCAGNYQIA